MCKPAEEGGQRCANHTRPAFTSTMKRLRAMNARGAERSTLRNENRGVGDTALLDMIKHASTPSGQGDVTDAAAKFASEGDVNTAAWLRTAAKNGATQAEVAKAFYVEYKAAKKRVSDVAAKARRSLTNNTNKLSRNGTPDNNLAGLLPDLAVEWDTERNEGIGPDEVKPFANVMVWWKCERGHQWTTKLNNRSVAARAGNQSPCPECHGRRQRTMEAMQVTLAEYVQALEKDPEAWQVISPAMRHDILERTGMMRKGKTEFERATIRALIGGEVTLKEIMRAKTADDLVKRIGTGVDSDDDDELEVTDGWGDAEVPEDTELDASARIDRIMAATGVGALISNDDLLVAQLLRESVEHLWAEAYNNPQDVDALLGRVSAGADANPYRARVAASFTEEITKVRSAALPEGYQTERVDRKGNPVTIDPLLSQRRFMTLVVEQRKVANWSGTGAGKTLSAVLSTEAIGANETMVLCPLSVTDHWAKEYQDSFPELDVRHGLPTAADTFGDDREGRRRVWIVNYDKFSGNAAKLEADLAPLAGHLDAVVLDEVHMAKAADPNNLSLRRGSLQGFIDKAGERNPQLAVIAATATPVVTNLEEGRGILRLVAGKDPDGFATDPTIKNAATAHKHLMNAGVRYKPKYSTTLTKAEEVVDVTAALPRVTERLERLKKASGDGVVTPAMMERALLPEKMPAIVNAVRNATGPTVVYSQYTTGMVDPIVERLRAEGFTAERFTGMEKQDARTALIEKFQNGEVQVIVGSQPIATGVDGLQKVCSNMVVASMPWTAAADDQLTGRLHRFGQTRDVKMTYVLTEAKVGTASWSWCKNNRMGRIKFRRSLGDAAVDGIMPTGTLDSEQHATSNALIGLAKLSAELTNA